MRVFMAVLFAGWRKLTVSMVMFPVLMCVISGMFMRVGNVAVGVRVLGHMAPVLGGNEVGKCDVVWLPAWLQPIAELRNS
jgi:hypothetical protein